MARLKNVQNLKIVKDIFIDVLNVKHHFKKQNLKKTSFKNQNLHLETLLYLKFCKEPLFSLFYFF